MPVFEYKCSECNTKFEEFHKSASQISEVTCPSCNSIQNKKLFSSFSSTTNNNVIHSNSGCQNGSCGLPYNGCTSGSCGLN